VLLDCSPALGVLSLNALLAADRVLMPVAADFLSLEGANNLTAALDVLETRQGAQDYRALVDELEAAGFFGHATAQHTEP